MSCKPGKDLYYYSAIRIAYPTYLPVLFGNGRAKEQRHFVSSVAGTRYKLM
jgi:hypothetical protein